MLGEKIQNFPVCNKCDYMFEKHLAAVLGMKGLI